MRPGGYPLAAIAGQPRLKLALLLAGVDWRLSVLLKGDKGSGKSTAARGLAEILPAGAPFVNLPIGTTADRLLGGLNLDRALQGEAALQPGLIDAAHGGVLYIDEVNLLADTLTDALLDVASSGVHHVERDGFSASGEARFALLGSMNLEEGGLRPQLLDRFALSLEVEAPAEAGERARIVEARLRFELDPEGFRAVYAAGQQRLREAVAEARARAPEIQPSAEILNAISQAVTDAGVRSLRADLAALRAARAHAALSGRGEVTADDIAAVLPLVLHHRAQRQNGPPPPPNAPPPRPPPEEPKSRGAEAADRVFPPEPRQAPEVRIGPAAAAGRGRSAAATASLDAEASPAAGTAANGALDALGSFTESFRRTGTAALQKDHLVFHRPRPAAGLRFVFVVDASGSQAAQARMRAVKGAAAALLASSVDARDEVAVISFRGARAEVVLEPCRNSERARRVLEYLPTGGRTPLAHALELARSLVTPSSVLVLLTDGRANVPLAQGDAWTDALEMAGRIPCPAILVDTTPAGGPDAQHATQALAGALHARLVRLDEWSETALLGVLQL